jgi:hypothetical protein
MPIWASMALTLCGIRRVDPTFLPTALRCAVCTIARSIRGAISIRDDLTALVSAGVHGGVGLRSSLRPWWGGGFASLALSKPMQDRSTLRGIARKSSGHPREICKKSAAAVCWLICRAIRSRREESGAGFRFNDQTTVATVKIAG